MDVRALLAVHREEHEGVAEDVVRRAAWIACDVVHTACVSLLHSVRTLSVAHMLVHRLYAAVSPREVDVPAAAAAAVLLAGKLDDDAFRPLANVALVVDYVSRLRATGGTTRVLRLRGERWQAWLEDIARAERRLLASMGFAVHAAVFSPPQTLVPYIGRAMCLDGRVAREAIAILNSVGRTDLLLRVAPEVSACAALQLGLGRLGVPASDIPSWEGRKWFAYFVFHCDASESDVDSAISTMRDTLLHPVCEPSAWLPSLRPADVSERERRLDETEAANLAKESYGLQVVHSTPLPSSTLPSAMHTSLAPASSSHAAEIEAALVHAGLKRVRGFG